MASTRFRFTLSLVLASLVGYSFEQSRAYPVFIYCDDYCNANGDWQDAGSCSDSYCCGNSTFRYCCRESSLDISNIYSDVSSCDCPNSDCYNYSTPIWEYVLYFFAPLAIFTIVAFFCFQCSYKRGCKKCKKTTDEPTTGNRNAATPSADSITTLPDAEGRYECLQLDQDFMYNFEPPSYETVTRDLPKYEDIVNEAGGYNGPFEFSESAEDLCAPTGEHEGVVTPPSEWLNNDAPPPSYTPTTHEEAQL